MNALASVAIPATAAPSSDVALLALCSVLSDMQAEWQRLWEATPDDHDPGAPTDADREFDAYCNTTCPGYEADPANDVVAKLGTLPATTLEGLQAKAAALCAIDDAGGYTGDCRSDECAMYAEFLKEVAGRWHQPLGEEYGEEPT